MGPLRNTNASNNHEAAGNQATSTDINITRLVKSAVGGDGEAFGELYGIYLDRIYRYVFYQVRDKMVAEDITEDVFVKAWKAINSCKGKEKTFSSWLYRIAHNQVIDVFRSRSKEWTIEMGAVIERSDSSLEVEKRADYQELLQEIACLPENQRQIIILKFIAGMDNREIGRITGKNQGAIRILQMRALANLRKKLNPEENEDGR